MVKILGFMISLFLCGCSWDYASVRSVGLGYGTDPGACARNVPANQQDKACHRQNGKGE